jgi:hypothetical protein
MADKHAPQSPRRPGSPPRADANPDRNRSPGVDASSADGGPEGNATLREVWDEPGGEAYAYRQSMGGAGNRDEGHDALTAAETPETTKHLSDATLTPQDRDATREAIDRATAVNGKDD